MTAAPLTDASRPMLARGVKLREDKARGIWILNAPERVVMLDEIAAAILRELDGARDIDSIVTRLSDRFEAPAGEIRADVLELLEDLLSKGYVTA